ncbi:MAG TPA: peptide ligase PGM1-related protein, partial [Propionibacteriaceae bacterium]
YLVTSLMLHRIEACELVFLTCQAPGRRVLDYYASLVPWGRRGSTRARFRLAVVPDDSPRPIAAKLLDRPDIIGALRASFAGRPAFIEPWNVTEREVEVAERLQVPIDGTAPDLWHLGFKSAGRRLFREAGVPLPAGREDVRTVNGMAVAAAEIREQRPTATGVVVKLDNSAAGDGNVVIEFGDTDGGTATREEIARRGAALPDWYLQDLSSGAIVEELITATRFTSPSVQVELSPFGEVRVLATHEQLLGGDAGQVYTGCRFPADPAYARELARHGRAIGELLTQRGVVGRLSVDFAAAQNDTGTWHIRALEINLRKGGTTHPYVVLSHLVPGHYDADAGSWRAADGTPRWYWSTDNLVDKSWLGITPGAVIGAVAAAGLQFDVRTGTGVVLHMLSCLAIDGRFGLTAIGRTPAHATDLYEATSAAVHRYAREAEHVRPS